MSAVSLQVRVARTADEVLALRPAWTSLQNDRVTADLDYYLCVTETEPGVIRPHVLVAERDGQAEAMLLARLRTIDLPCRLGYQTVYAPKLRALSAALGGTLGEITAEHASAFVDELLAALRRSEADVAMLRHLALDSTLYRTAVERPPSFLRQKAALPNRYWETTLPDSFDEFSRSLSKKTRDGFRRYANRFVREYGDRIEIREFRQPAQIDQLFRDVEAVAAKSWQRGLGVGFADDARTRARTRLALDRSWLRAWVLYVDERPIAFWMGDVYRGRFRSLIPGYDPEFAAHRVGNFVLMHMIEQLCADEDVRVLDFGFGDVEYKERLADRNWSAADALIFAPTLKGIRVSLLRRAIGGVNTAGLRLARSLGILGRLKRGWRRRFAGAASERGSAGREAQAGEAGGGTEIESAARSSPGGG
jgi:CelD/BcsL family acetyltransferase involved in cellulose biosynthesis